MLHAKEVKMPNARLPSDWGAKGPVSLASQPRMLREPGLWLRLKITLKHLRFLIEYSAAYGSLALGINCLYSSINDQNGESM